MSAVIYCEDPVATLVHRAAAAAIDVSMVLIGYGLFLLAYRLTGGEFGLTSANMAILGGVLPVLAVAYGLFWAVAGEETFGMNAVELRLLTFDGFPPELKQRLLRFAGTCLSVIPCGLGLLWGLGDEESLTWPDHMSRTFLTPRASAERTFQRR